MAINYKRDYKFMFIQRLALLIVFMTLAFSYNVRAQTETGSSDSSSLTNEELAQASISSSEAPDNEVFVHIQSTAEVVNPDIPVEKPIKVEVESTAEQLDSTANKVNERVAALIDKNPEPVALSISGRNPSTVSKVITNVINAGLMTVRGGGNFYIAYSGALYYGNAYNSWLGPQVGAGVQGAVLFATSAVTQYFNPTLQKFLNNPVWFKSLFNKIGIKLNDHYTSVLEVAEKYFRYSFISGTSLVISNISSFVIGLNDPSKIGFGLVVKLAGFTALSVVSMGTFSVANAAIKQRLQDNLPTSYSNIIQTVSNFMETTIGLIIAGGSVAMVNGEYSVSLKFYGIALAASAVANVTNAMTKYIFKEKEAKEGPNGILGRFCNMVRKMIAGKSS